MDGSGIRTLNFLSNKKIHIVSVGEVHEQYNYNSPNTIHCWINKGVVDRADVIVEDLYFENIYYNSSKAVIMRYFDPLFIFNPNNIRLEFFILQHSSDLIGVNNDAGKIFLRNPETTQILEKCKIVSELEKFKAQVPENFIYIKKSNIAPVNGLSYFIEESFKYGNIYDRICNNPGRTEVKNILSDNAEDLIVENHQMSREIIYKLCMFGFLLFQYVKYNFIYRVARFINKISNHPLNKVLYDWIIQTINKYEQIRTLHNITEICAILYDYIAVLKILDIYEESSEPRLIWICSGSNHNKTIELFIIEIFNKINDGLSITKFAGALNNDVNKPVLTLDDKFINFVQKNPHYGLVPNKGYDEIPTFIDANIGLIKRYFIKDYMDDEKSVSFKLLKEGEDILTIKSNAEEQNNPVVINHNPELGYDSSGDLDKKQQRKNKKIKMEAYKSKRSDIINILIDKYNKNKTKGVHYRNNLIYDLDGIYAQHFNSYDVQKYELAAMALINAYYPDDVKGGYENNTTIILALVVIMFIYLIWQLIIYFTDIICNIDTVILNA